MDEFVLCYHQITGSSKRIQGEKETGEDHLEDLGADGSDTEMHLKYDQMALLCQSGSGYEKVAGFYGYSNEIELHRFIKCVE
jgi:hypothetical protein